MAETPMTEIDQLYVDLAEDLSPPWTPGRTQRRRSLSIRHGAISAVIRAKTGTDIFVQFWKNSIGNLNLEFAGEKSTQLRERLAESLRAFIFSESTPDWVLPSKTSTVVHLSRKALEENRKGAVVGFFRYVSGRLETWAEEVLPAVLAGSSPQRSWWDTALRMARTSASTAAYANGQEVSRRAKNNLISDNLPPLHLRDIICHT